MAPVIRSLEQISTGHTVFERDQVLTHDQLNSLAGYADDQIRLTRVRLLGVGVVCGLRVSLLGGTVSVTRGIGVTTDGDLLHLDRDTVFDRFKPYDRTYPAYPPLYAGGEVEGEMLAAFELVPRGAQDSRAQDMGRFGAVAGRALGDTTALLLMESYIRDDDLCSGTDCDNLGREAVNTPKLLVVARSEVGPLREGIVTPGGAAGQLEEVVADRPGLAASINSAAALAGAFRTACNNTHARLAAALPRVQSACSAFLGDALPSGGAGAWLSRLNAVRDSFANSHVNIQYYYDFLKDVVDTYNELRERLFGDTTTCAPPVDGFPKHLLLGDLSPGADRDANRTGFYPSPLTGRSAGELEHARFLVRKLGALIAGFQPPSGGGNPIRVTPSAWEDRPLEERAIPFYYAPGGADPIHRSWSYRLSSRGMDTHNYSYHAASYRAGGGAANPLGSQIGRFPFFRVEGHVGRTVSDATSAIEAEIRARNLPFAVRSVLLGQSRDRVVKRPGVRFTDLHHLHHLLRRDLVRQLDEVRQFSDNFRTRVVDAVQQGVVVDSADDGEGVSMRRVAEDSDADVGALVQAARAPMEMSYAQYRSAPAWQSNVSNLLRATGQFKSQLGSVVKTDFNTPFDTLIGSRQVDWLPWLDRILDAREEKEDERLLFRTFVGEHPGVEHFGGVTRGGTLVLLYDDSGVVVGDVMLPYHAPEPAAEAVEPQLPEPGVRPPYVVAEGIKIIPPRTKFFNDRILNFKNTVLDPQINERLSFQTQHFDLFKESYLNVFKDSLSVIKNTSLTTGGRIADQFSDATLGFMMEESDLKRQRLETLTQQAARPNVTPEERAFLDRQIEVAQEDLALTTRRITEYVSEAEIEVRTGTEGFKAVMEVTGNMSLIPEGQVLDTTRSTLGNVVDTTRNAGLRNMLGGVLRL